MTAASTPTRSLVFGRRAVASAGAAGVSSPASTGGGGTAEGTNGGGGVFFTGGATTGNGGGLDEVAAIGGALILDGTAGGAATTGGADAAGDVPSTAAAGGATGDGTLGFSLNLPGSAGADAGVEALAVDAVGAGESEKGGGGATNGAGPGATIVGFSIVGGSITAAGGSTAGAGVGVAGADGVGDSAGALAMRGLKRIFGAEPDCSGVSGAGGVPAGTPVEMTGGGGGNETGSPTAGTPAGACPSAGRRRGFSLRANGGVTGSSLIVRTKTLIRAGAKRKKFPSLSTRSAPTFKLVFNMIKAFLCSVCIATLCLSSGCLFSKKANRAKESSAIAADVEESFRKRWVDKRASELTTGGTTADAARTQAETEFRERFGFTRAGQK